MANVDFLHTAASKFAARFFVALSDQNVALAGANVPGFAVGTDNVFVASSLGHTWILKPTLLNEVRLGFNRLLTSSVPQSPFKFSEIGVAAPAQNDAVPMVTISGSYAMVSGQRAQRTQNTFLLEDALSWTHGRHTVRFGGGLNRINRYFNNPSQNQAVTFQSFADFLLGLNGAQNGTNIFSNIFTSVQLTGLFNRVIQNWEASAYTQDDYRILPSLTLNLGLRYEFLPPFSEALGRFSNFDPSLMNPNPPVTGTLAGLVVASNFAGVLPAGVVETDTETIMKGEGSHNWAPRLGLAWKVFPNSSRLVLRIGYGIYYSKVTGQVQTQNTTVQPFGLLQALGGPANAAATWSNPFPAAGSTLSAFPFFTPYSPTTRLTANVVDPLIRPGVVQHYSLNLQSEFARDFLLELGYVGTRGTRLQRLVSLNQAQLASAGNPIRGVTTNTVANIPSRVPFQGWTSGLMQVQSKGSMWYNGLEASVTKGFSKGLQFLASYTWSKTLDTDGANVESNSSAGTVIGNQNDDRQRYGPSSFSRPHRFVVSYIYELPWLKAATGWRRILLGNWAVAGVTTFQAGHPLTLTGTNGSNIFGITSDRAALAPGCNNAALAVSGPVDKKINGFFNSNCINRANLNAPLSSSNPARWPIVEGTATDFGNSGVGIVQGPDQRSFDITLIKRTSTAWPTDAGNVEFRTEFFNVFNTPNFSDPDTNVSSASFGRITSTSIASRIVQFALKFNF